MAAQAGAFLRETSVIKQDLTEQLRGGLLGQSPDGIVDYRCEHLYMAYGGHKVTPESVAERQPFSSRGWVLTWDGRLDNRDELIKALGKPGETDVSDAELVGRSLDALSQDCLKRLEGDWALAAWRAQDSTLLLARDYVGTCPLYYCTYDGMVLWTSELESLHSTLAWLTGASLRLNRDWVVSYFSMDADPTAAPFEGVQVVPPGHFVQFDNERIKIVEYWEPHPSGSIRYGDDREYEDHFHQLFAEAVRCRLRSKGRVWAQLSGGLDSSAIVCMADHVVKTGVALGARIETVSATYDSSPESDERRFIDAVENSRGLRGRHFSDLSYPPISLPFHHHRTGTPEFADLFSLRERAICQAMLSDGSAVQLSGEGGDELLGNIGDGIPNLLDALHHRSFRNFGSSLQKWATSLKQSQLSVLGNVVAEMLPDMLRGQLTTDKSVEQRARVLDTSFVASATFARHCVAPVRPSWRLDLPSARLRADALKQIIGRLSRTSLRRMGPIHITYPYLHRPLVSFLLAIPADQLARPGERRSLMRRALRAILPPEVASRQGKRSPDAALYRALNIQWQNLQPFLQGTLSAKLGILDEKALQDVAVRAHLGTFPASLFLIALCFEMWLLHNADLIDLPVSHKAAVAWKVGTLAAMSTN